ncbi:MAG TPA: hypothetical protein VEI50_00020 [Nitrospiraceae bacterium]|nr:hypothetical protein [Nitrospiraceae bacterium]
MSDDVRCYGDPAQNPPYGSRTQSDALADRNHSETLPSAFKHRAKDCGIGLLDLPPSSPLAPRSHTCDAGFDPLLNHRPFELRKDPHQPEERFAGRRGGVDALRVDEDIEQLC